MVYRIHGMDKFGVQFSAGPQSGPLYIGQVRGSNPRGSTTSLLATAQSYAVRGTRSLNEVRQAHKESEVVPREVLTKWGYKMMY